MCDFTLLVISSIIYIPTFRAIYISCRSWGKSKLHSESQETFPDGPKLFHMVFLPVRDMMGVLLAVFLYLRPNGLKYLIVVNHCIKHNTLIDLSRLLEAR
jgi:hypothetical protein